MVGAICVVIGEVLGHNPHSACARRDDQVAKRNREVVGELVVVAMILRTAVGLQQRIRRSDRKWKDVF
ncbi:hypothetical protein ACFLT9_03395 [Acidobacteriota bacterium]